jgi:hypothetical protein
MEFFFLNLKGLHSLKSTNVFSAFRGTYKVTSKFRDSCKFML